MAKPGAIEGAGAATAGPLVDGWGALLKPKGLRVDYRGTGASEGLSQLQGGAVEFAGVETPAGAGVARAEGRGSLARVPLALGAVTVSYNLPGFEAGLKLDGKTIADIFLGKVRFWNDPAIARLNPGVVLPKTKVRPLHRTDPSGATALFTQFLSESSPQWRRQVGSGRTIKWPVGMTFAGGGEPLVHRARRFRGAISYIELPYALKQQPCCEGGVGLGQTAVAAVPSSSGKFVVPGAKSVAGAFPLPTVEYALVPRDLCRAGGSRKDATAVRDFLGFALGAGQATAEKLHYAPLPVGLLSESRATVAELTCDGKPLAASSGF